MKSVSIRSVEQIPQLPLQPRKSRSYYLWEGLLAVGSTLALTGIIYAFHLYPTIPNISLAYLPLILIFASTPNFWVATAAGLRREHICRNQKRCTGRAIACRLFLSFFLAAVAPCDLVGSIRVKRALQRASRGLIRIARTATRISHKEINIAERDPFPR